MVLYNFKSITVVPTGKEFIDITLSKTQRKTPTVVHPQYSISRIRSFYMRKVKFAQQTIHDRLSQILDEFPLLDDIHPFYADLMNVLYDRDHYKLALGQLNMARHIVDNLAKDYLKMLKYGDSLYRCKQLKKAALGRMATLLKQQSSSLAYLEQVRQHLARLPTIDPNTRTLILCGYPNVGKSSFLNKVTRANVDVQPYPFTTKSLFVGHTDYKYLRWQVIDTPGILDHPLEQRNTIEMQSITALAHLRAAILFLIDISEQCGYSIEQQVSLYQSIKPLFANKPILLVCNKIDVRAMDDLPAHQKKLIDSIKEGNIIPMSNMTEEGIMDVKNQACERLLEQRVEQKMAGKKVQAAINRLHVATPVSRDDKTRPALIPESVLKAKEEEAVDMNEEKEEEEEEAEEVPFWLRNFNDLSHKKKYLLDNPDWKLDHIPEIIDGKNIADFIDPEILQRLEELEEEEEGRITTEENEMEDEEEVELTEEQLAQVKEIRGGRRMAKHDSNALSSVVSKVPQHVKATRQELSDFEAHLVEMGINPNKAAERIRERSRSRSASREGRKRSRSESADGMEVEGPAAKKSRSASKSPSRVELAIPLLKDRQKAEKLARMAFKPRNKQAKKGEADRHIPDLKPKHLFSGVRGMGKTQRR